MPPKALLCAFGGLLIVKFILHSLPLNDLRGGGPLAVVGIKTNKVEIPRCDVVIAPYEKHDK